MADAITDIEERPAPLLARLSDACQWVDAQDELGALVGEAHDALQEMLVAGRAVVARWDRGDLAGAVRQLAAAIAKVEAGPHA